MAEETYRYSIASAVTVAEGGTDVLIGTTDLAGCTFSGHVRHGDQAARAIVMVADVAGTRFYVPAAMTAAILRAADPVITCAPEVLRFESLSACCGVYARLDLDAGSLDADRVRFGTTNIDAGPAFRAALGQVGHDDPIHLEVGADEVRVRTLGGHAVEHRVPLPDRWVKGLAEVPATTSGFVLRHQIGAAEAQRFLQGVRRGSAARGTAWVVPSGSGLRVAARPTPEAVGLAGPQRLAPLLQVLPHIRGLRAYGPPPPPPSTQFGAVRPAEASAWEAQLDDARVVLVLSADVSRGFSGEGAVLADVATAEADLVERVDEAVDGSEPVTVTALVARLGADEDAVRRALGSLAAAGRVGHDLGTDVAFARVLPFARERLAVLHPRLAGARRLVEADAVTILNADAALVRSNGVDHRVTGAYDTGRCTCPWYGRHRGDRGPCKHALAVALVRGSGATS